MSYSLTDNLSDIEDGEIPSPPCSQKASDLEDLSSCEEIFSSDSRTSHSPRNNRHNKQHHSKVFRTDGSTSCQRKETVAHDKPNGGAKRVHARRRSSMKINECKVSKKDRLRGVQRRERSISFSSDDESELHRRGGRCGKRRVRRVRKKSKNSDSSLMNVIEKKKSEPSKNVMCSYPEKIPPKSSLKKRLMTMISLASSASNEVEGQEVVAQVDTRIDLEPEATKEIADGGNDICKCKIPKKVKDTTFEINVEQKKLLEQDSAMEHLPAPEEVVIEVPSAEDQQNSSVAGDEDLANLRKLALEALKKKAPVKVQETVFANDESDDLTELRLRALHSAVLKKHIARKAKAAAAASSAAASASALSVAVVAPALPPTASTSQPAIAASISPERPQANAVSFSNDGNRCADNCDKTTVIVDMDLENTSEEDSQPAGCSDNGMQPYRNDSSPYYTPELWTPIVDESFDRSFNGSSFPNSSSGLDDLNISLNQPLHIPLVQSVYSTPNVSNILPIVDRQQTSSNFEPIPIIHRNKYSDRPNLVKLPVVPMCYEKQTNHNINIANMYSSSETGVSTYTNCQSVRASSLIQINLQGESSEVNNPIERNEVKEVCDPHDEETSHQRQYPDGGTDASDAENMDISSMIVVDEIDCTSPEPDATSSVNNSNSDSQSASNILTIVPVPSSQYSNRSKLPNNSTSTAPNTHNIPNPIQRQKLSSGNPFTLNNLRKKNALLNERKVLETGSSINVELPARPNFQVTRKNQKSFSSIRGLNNPPPIANKGGSGRFVIHLGEDSDSEDDGQTTNQEFSKLPKRTIINEIALQQNSSVNKQASIPDQDTTSFDASLDAFFKQTRALYDLKHAKEKEALQLEGPITNSGKHTVKELGTDEDLPNTSSFFNVRTVVAARNVPVKESTASPPQKRRRISISAIDTKHSAQYKLVEQSIGKQENGVQIGRQECGTVVGRPECGTVIGKPECEMKTERVLTASTTMVAGKRSIQNITVTVGNKAVRTPAATIKRNKQRITFNASSADSVKASNENTAPASGFKAGLLHGPKNITRPEISGIGSTAAKPQNLKASNAVKLVTPSTVLPNRDEITKSIQPYKPPSAALAAASDKLVSAVADEKPALAAANNKQSSGSIAQDLKPSQMLKSSTPPLASRKPVKLVRGSVKPPVVGAVNQEIQVKNVNSIQTGQSIEVVPQKAHDSRSNQVISESTNQATDERSLKLTESRLLRERSSLLVDLTFISDNLNDSSKYDQGIKESLETISQQKKIIELATRSLTLARERIANDIKKKSQIFSLINNKRKIVASKREVCLKLQTECVNLGSKVKGQSYVAPQYLESELSIKLKDVGAEISKSIKCVLPQQKTNLPSANTADDDKQSLPNNVAAASVPKTDVSIEVDQPPDAPPSESVGENRGQILWLMDCPYEKNGICGDVTECPFLHKKHR